MRKEEGACQAQVGNWGHKKAKSRTCRNILNSIFSLDVFQFQICLLH